MKTKRIKLNSARLNRLRAQGYTCQRDEELTDLAFGNRFACGFCSTLLFLGVIMANIPLLALLMLIAFMCIVLPYHPFDYVYNHLLSHRMSRPQLPPRSKQFKFACMLATSWIGATIYLFLSGLLLSAYILGGMLIFSALLVSTTDICIPSIIYNAFTRRIIRISKSDI